MASRPTFELRRKGNGTPVTDLRFDFWLSFDESGTMSMSRNKPSVHRTERAMFMQVTLPLSLWATPEIKASVVVADGGALNVDIAKTSEALKAILGVDVDIRVVAAPGAPE